MVRRRRASVVLPDELGPDRPMMRFRSVYLFSDMTLLHRRLWEADKSDLMHGRHCKDDDEDSRLAKDLAGVVTQPITISGCQVFNSDKLLNNGQPIRTRLLLAILSY